MTRPDEQPRSPCYGDRRFTTNKPHDIAEAIAICVGCTFRACQPILADILANPTNAQCLEGVWDGEYYSQSTTARRETA